MRVLVTGGCGFLGSHTCEFYRARGDTVVSYDSMTKHELLRTGYVTERARSYNEETLRGLGVDLVRGDIRNYPQLLEAAQGAEFIVHTAAQPAMTIGLEDPDLDFSTNVLGSYNVLKVARELAVPVVSCSSIHVYGNGINDTLTEGESRFWRTPAEIDEEHPLLQGTLTPLHASKRSAEIYLQTFVDSYQLQAANFRLTGLYGPHQFGGEDHGWVANFCIRAAMGWPITLFGTGKQVRDIIYATDAVRAFHAFYERPQPGTYNIGGGSRNAISLSECIELIGEILGRQPTVRTEAARKGDLWYFVCDSSRARRELNWASTVEPREGVTRLLVWIEQNRACFRG